MKSSYLSKTRNIYWPSSSSISLWRFRPGYHVRHSDILLQCLSVFERIYRTIAFLSRCFHLKYLFNKTNDFRLSHILWSSLPFLQKKLSHPHTLPFTFFEKKILLINLFNCNTSSWYVYFFSSNSSNLFFITVIIDPWTLAYRHDDRENLTVLDVSINVKEFVGNTFLNQPYHYNQ